MFFVCLFFCFFWLLFSHGPVEVESFLNGSIWPQDGTLTSTINPGQVGSRNNINNIVSHTPKISRTGTTPSDAVLCHTQDTPFWVGGSYPSAGRNTVGVFLSTMTGRISDCKHACILQIICLSFSIIFGPGRGVKI